MNFELLLLGVGLLVAGLLTISCAKENR